MTAQPELLAKHSYNLADETATRALALQLASCLDSAGLVFLEGTLGAGKTAFCRGLIHALGHEGAVKSPTYTLVEDYPLSPRPVYHFDLYRLGDPEELEFMGIRDYLDGDALCLVEWPDKGRGVLPTPDLVVSIDDPGEGRIMTLGAFSDRGQRWLTALISAVARNTDGAQD